MSTDVLTEPSSINDAVIGLLVPFIAFYIGVLMRYKLRRALFPQDTLTLGELATIGVLFSLIAVSPVVPLFQAQATIGNIKSYLGACITLIEAGMLMPDSIGRKFVRNRIDDHAPRSVHPLHETTQVT